MKQQKNNNEDGFLSFDPEELKNATQEGHPNNEAYELLWEATCVSSHVNDVDKAAGTTDEENVYPTSAEEVDKMEELVDKAAQALKEPDQAFSQRVGELRDIIEWSRKRHWQFNWRIIVGAIVSAFLLPMFLGADQNHVREMQNNVAKVNKWEPVELVHFESMEELLASNIKGCDSKYEYDSPTNWYNSSLHFIAWHYTESTKDIEECEAQLKDPEMEWRYESIKEHLPNAKKRKEEAVERFEKIKDLDYEGVKKAALKEAEARVAGAEFADAFVNFIVICFVLMIPLYVFATRPYGYMMSRHRRESKVMGKLEKIALWLSGGMLAAEAGIGYVDIVKEWSDGSTTREDDGSGPVRLVIKVALIAGAVILYCTVSSILMIYATITGLIRNYDWKEIKNKLAKVKSAR